MSQTCFPSNPEDTLFNASNFNDCCCDSAGIVVLQNGPTGPTGAVGATGAGGILSYYGSFFDTTTQTNLATTNYIQYNSTAETNGITISGVNNDTVNIVASGTYNIQFSAVFQQTPSSASLIDVWLERNGNPVADTNTQLAIRKELSVEAWNFVLTFNAGDTFKLAWYSPESTVKLVYLPAQVLPTRPATPSIILTITQCR